MPATPTVFLSAATIDLKEWRDVLHVAFSRAGFRVLTQDQSLGSALGDVKRLLTGIVDESDCVVHLAGMGYGSDATAPFPDAPRFQCSWTQFEYYHAHEKGKDVIAFVCAPDLSRAGFIEEGNAADIARKQRLQQEHRERVASGKFDDTPLAGKVGRTSNEQVDSIPSLLKAVAAAVGTLHRLGDSGKAASAALDLMRSFHQLPPRPAGFVGREEDLAKLRALNPASGAVLTGLRGMGGIGKTALALVLAHEWAARFPDAQLFLDARGTQADPPSARKLMEQVVLAFHPTAKLPDDPAAIAGIYRDVLGGKKVLILLDNARDAAQAAPLIPPAGCALIVTSRHSFMLGKTAPHNVDRLPDDEAVVLLREFHGALGEADAAALVKRCAGLPLALRIAGAHLALDAAERGSAADVAGYLRVLGGGRLQYLDAEAADAGVVTITETLRLSEMQLPEAEREAWRKLGVFTAGFDARAAEAIAGADATMLGHFVRRSLLEREGAERYKIHDLAADYARAQLGDAARTELHLVHARHYTAVGDEAEDLYKKGDAVGGLALFDRERAQIEAAYTWLRDKVIPGFSPSNRISVQDSPASEADRAKAPDYFPAAARQLITLVNAVTYTGNLRIHPRQRIAWLESQLRAARIVEDRRHEGNALGNLGLAYADLGDARKAIEYYEQDLAIRREIGDRRGEGNALGLVGGAHADLGDARKAIGYFEQALAIAREIGGWFEEGNALGSLGTVHAELGDTRKAIEYFEKHLLVTRVIRDRRGEGIELGNLGGAHLLLGDAHNAVWYFEQCLATAREIGDRRGEGTALGYLGNAHAALRDPRKAIEFYEQQLIIVREIGDRRGEGNALWNAALAHESLGNRPEAIARGEAALAIREAIEDPNAAKVRAKLAEWRGVA